MPLRSPETTDRYTKRARQNKRRDLIATKQRATALTFVQTWIRRCLYFLLRTVFQNDPIKSKLQQWEVRSILIIPFGDAIGDLILATPLWRAVKSRIPHCKIGVLTSSRNSSLLEGDSDVDTTYQFGGRRDLSHSSELLRARREHYQIVLNLHFTHLSDYGFFSNIIGPQSIKVTGNHPRRKLYEIFFNYIGLRDRHTVGLSTMSLELLSEVIEFEPPIRLSESWPSLAISERAMKKVKERLNGIEDFILIQQQAATPFREWGIDNSMNLAKRYLADNPRSTVFIIASPSMLESFNTMVASSNDPRIQTFPTDTLSELAALIKLAKLVISPETSIPHFASALQTPVIVLLPDRENIPIEWLPIGTRSKLLAPSTRGDAVETIAVDCVLDAVNALHDSHSDSSQTSLNLSLPLHPMFQRENGNLYLKDFSVPINHNTTSHP